MNVFFLCIALIQKQDRSIEYQITLLSILYYINTQYDEHTLSKKIQKKQHSFVKRRSKTKVFRNRQVQVTSTLGCLS